MQHWTVHLEGGPRRVNHAAVAIGDLIFSFGGYCTGDDYETTLPMDVHVLDTVSLRWKLVPPSKPTATDDKRYEAMPYQRYGHSAIAYEESAYIWGGRNDIDGACNTLFRFNIVTREWCSVHTSGTRPGARDGHSACLIKSHMYIFGGYEEEIDRFSNDIHSYNFKTNMWEHIRAKGNPARWRDFHSSIGIGDTMYVFGGRSDLGGDTFTNQELYCNSIQLYNTLTRTWHEPVACGALPVGRRSHSVFEYDGCMYVFGGYNGRREKHFNDLNKFDPETNQWSKVKVQGTGPCPRRRQCCCKINTTVYVFGGTSPMPDSMRSDNVDNPEERGLVDMSDLHVLDLQPSLKTLAKLAVLTHQLDTSCLTRDLRWELAAMTTPNSISRPPNSNG